MDLCESSDGDDTLCQAQLVKYEKAKGWIRQFIYELKKISPKSTNDIIDESLQLIIGMGREDLKQRPDESRDDRRQRLKSLHRKVFNITLEKTLDARSVKAADLMLTGMKEHHRPRGSMVFGNDHSDLIVQELVKRGVFVLVVKTNTEKEPIDMLDVLLDLEEYSD